ncbi:hypothetical protein Rhopal_004801-T1 [Rhodotorula paludigena]|uniref:TRP C-terminal domain-containing protein n=1 Tax=Rhodotorula paludigena TaxID=86838 RepID=A0AAV5GT21_9BASI|nr:hypothetical protein Rhopal_004801-T1 [Rhodotorula paludigena]
MRALLLYSTRLSSCLSSGSNLVAPEDQQLVFTQLYAQLDQGQTQPGEHAAGTDFDRLPSPVYNQDGAILTGTGDLLRIVLTGSTVARSEGYSNGTGDDPGLLSTLLVDSQVLSFDVASNRTALCAAIRTNEGTTGMTTNGTAVVTDSGCPYEGDVALGFVVPLASSYPLTTITTNLVALDSSSPAQHLACYDLHFTPYYPDYFAYGVIRYFVIGLLALYLLLYVLARFFASYTTWLQDNETQLASSLTLKLTSRDGTPSHRGMWKAIWFGGWAGRQVIASGSLRRFVTAEFREIFSLVAWFSLVGTVAVEWPGFAYPVFKQIAWTTLVYNASLPFASPAPPVLPQNATVPSLYASQIADVTSPLYLDTDLPNVLLDLDGESDGLGRWARMIGVRDEDVWSICAFTFFALCAGVIAVHAVLFAIDSAIEMISPERQTGRTRRLEIPTEDKHGAEGDESLTHALSKEASGTHESLGGGRRSDGSIGRFLGSGDFNDDDYLDGGDDFGRNPEDDFSLWQLHLSLLGGNLVRILLLFHLPLCLFSAYQFTLYSDSPTSTFALAVVTFALVCLAAPVGLLWLIHIKPTRDLHGHLPTLLALGPLYNTYAEECTLFPTVTFASNLIVGAVVGAAQSEGTAQAAVILLVEVAHTLCTSLWLPWGDNSAMGPLAFLLSLARIVIAVLLVVLSPSVDVAPAAASWVTYIVFLAQGLVIVLLLAVVAFKFLELVVRVVARVPFDESRSPRGGGLFGALRKLDRRSGSSGAKKRRPRPGSAAAAGNARTQAARRRAIEERRRRNLHRERFAGGTLGGVSDASSVGTQTYLLPSARGPAGHPGAAGSTPSLAGGKSPFPSSGLVDDEGFIMSAMSTRGWESASEASSSRPGFVKPGTYSSSMAAGPILRSGPQHWGSQVDVVSTASPASAIVVPAATAVTASPQAGAGGSGSSGFARVGGGRASHSNPYQLANTPSSSVGTAYPPYPASSADMYGPHRTSQSAVRDMAAAPILGGDAQRYPSRPSIGGLPSSSALLSNSVSPGGRLDDEHNRRLSTRVRAKKGERQGGFFGRFKRQRPQYSDEDEFTDETDTDDEAAGRRPARGGGVFAALGLRGGRGKARRGRGGGDSADEMSDRGGYEHEEPPFESVPSGETGFSVVRKPRPRPSPALASASSPNPASARTAGVAGSQPATPTTAASAPSDPLHRPATPPTASTPPPPHVSVEAPSRPGSLHGEVVGQDWEEEEERRE